MAITSCFFSLCFDCYIQSTLYILYMLYLNDLFYIQPLTLFFLGAGCRLQSKDAVTFTFSCRCCCSFSSLLTIEGVSQEVMAATSQPPTMKLSNIRIWQCIVIISVAEAWTNPNPWSINSIFFCFLRTSEAWTNPNPWSISPYFPQYSYLT